MPNLISIVGPTATGKSGLALEVAEQWLADGRASEVVLLSADSRQVYRGLEITSGADIPEGFVERSSETRALSFFESSSLPIKLYGVACIEVTAEWSVAHFAQLFKQIVSGAAADALVIVVGGTGLYHQQAAMADPQLSVPPNEDVREQAEGMEVSELQLWLQRVNAVRFEHMNDSDRQNPRRLVRAIEIALAQPQPAAQTLPELPNFERELTIGLTAPLEWLEAKIVERVRERFENGSQTEVSRLLHLGDRQRLPALTATGVKEVMAFLEGSVSQDEVIAQWSLREFQYAKRQLTWWKKREGIEWFDVSSDEWRQQALMALEK